MTGILAVLAALALAGLDYFLIAVCCRSKSVALPLLSELYKQTFLQLFVGFPFD